MSRIEWTRLSGDDVEEVVAVLLSRKHPDCIRIRPSQGDGGIDLLLPQPDGSYHVLQVKKFAENLRATQKKQIEKSLKRLTTYAGEQGLLVTRWDLVTPLDPTKENLQWLQGLPTLPNVTVGWRGLIFIEGLVAEFPDVVDYYVRGGKERLQAAVADLTALLRQQSGATDGVEELSAADAGTLLTTLSKRVNAHDPHYSYDLHVTERPLDHRAIDPERLVFVSQVLDANPSVAIAVRARFADAPNIRPIPLSLNIRVPQGSDLEQEVLNFRDYGTDLVLPGEHFDLTADLPGGLSPSPGASTLLKISANPSPNATPQEMRFSITAPDGEELATTTVVLTSSTTGVTGIGGVLHGVEIGEVFDVTLRLNFAEQKLNISVNTRDLASKRLETVRAGVEFMAHFHTPNRLTVHNPYRPQAGQGPMQIGHARDLGAVLQRDIVEALLEIQRAAGRTVRIPPLLGRSAEEFEPWLEAAHLLRREELRVGWTELTFTAAQEPPQDLLANLPGAFIVHHPLTVSVGGEVLDLGLRQFYSPAVQLKADLELPMAPGSQVVLVPAEDPIAVIRWVRPEGS
ncbi:restriction endonuclease [Streptomyces spiralis]|uniref:restriction endonuclease n=1 Tax=Streptomyces spiralis TaxID=66376 RepID=UPI0034019430